MNAPLSHPKNATKHLLSMVDAQMKHCPPNVWPCNVTETDILRVHALKNFWPILNPRGLPETFLILMVWSTNAHETHSFSTAFSLN